MWRGKALKIICYNTRSKQTLNTVCTKLFTCLSFSFSSRCAVDPIYTSKQDRYIRLGMTDVKSHSHLSGGKSENQKPNKSINIYLDM